MRDQEGFTLVEVLVAVCIFMLGILGVIALFGSAAKSGRQAADETNAALLAQTVVAELRSQVNAGHKITAVIERSHDDFPGYKYSVEAVELDDGDREYYVEIDIFWKRRSRVRSEKFKTIIIRKE